MPITDLLERNSKLYGDEVALVEINPEIKEEQRLRGENTSLYSRLPQHITEDRSRGLYLMRKQTELQICSSKEESKKGRNVRYFL